MNLLPENPKKRQLILVVTGIATALFAFGFLYITYFSSSAASEAGSAASQGGVKIKNVSENMIEKLKKDVADIQDELNNDFYKNLKRYVWPKGPAVKAGNPNPFAMQNSK